MEKSGHLHLAVYFKIKISKSIDHRTDFEVRDIKEVNNEISLISQDDEK